MENNALVPVEAIYQIEQYRERVEWVVTQLKELSVETKENAEMALDIACDAINLKEKIDEKRKEIIEPAKKFQGMINGMAKDFTENLDKAKEIVCEKVGNWKMGTDEVESLETSKVLTTELPDFGFDIEDMAMVPKEYLTVDEARIKLAMKQGVRVIPGLHLKKSTKISIRRK